MIIDSTMDHLQECENYYLKRKFEINFNDPDSNTFTTTDINSDDCEQSYIQPKKRHLTNFHAINKDNFNDHNMNTLNSNNNCDEIQNNSELIEINTNGTTPTTTTEYNFNNDIENAITTTAFATNDECQNTDFLNYDYENHTIVISPSSSSVHAIHNSAVFITTTDTNDTNWQQNSTDLLELDHRYNSININNIMSSPSQSSVSTSTINEKNTRNHNHQTITTTPQTDSDFEDKNLSWLFNFKLDELPHLSPEVNRTAQISSFNNGNKNQNNDLNDEETGTGPTMNKHKSQIGKKVDELILEATSSEFEENNINSSDENMTVENNIKTLKKPPFTYTELIEYALEDKRELTVSGIYQWISDRFPFYKSNDDRWKNSVRHNLSINPHFRKGVKAPQGAGHLWTISSRDSEENTLAWEHKKQRLELFFRMEKSLQQKQSNYNNQSDNVVYDEAATAAANLLRQLQNDDEISSSSVHEQQQQQNINNNCSSPSMTSTTTTVITNNSHQHPYQNMSHHNVLTELNEDDLQKAAGEILNGVRRDVEVQSLNLLNASQISTYHDSLLDTTSDYLNPINKDDIVVESGLRQRHNDIITNASYETEIDPIELDIHMSNVEEEVLFSDEFNLNYFGITSGNDIVA